MKLPRVWVIAGLAVLLAVAIAASWQFAWRKRTDKGDGSDNVLRADTGYWISMFIAGTLGTVIGDYCSHDLHLGDASASLLLSPILGLMFVAARGGLLRSLWFYWLSVVAVRSAGTVVGDFFASRNMLGLPLSTLITGALFIALLAWWRQPNASKLAPVN